MSVTIFPYYLALHYVSQTLILMSSMVFLEVPVPWGGITPPPPPPPHMHGYCMCRKAADPIFPVRIGVRKLLCALGKPACSRGGSTNVLVVHTVPYSIT